MEKIINKNSELFWLHKFHGEHEAYAFPWEGGEEAEQYQLTVSLPEAACAEILKVCKQSPQAVLTYFVAGLSLNLYRYLNRPDFIICTAGRDEILPLKMEVNGSFRNLLGQAKAAVAEALQYSNYSFDQFLEKRRKRNKQAVDGAFRKVFLGYGKFDYESGHDLHIFLDEQLSLTVRFTAAPHLREVAEGFINSYIHTLVHTREFLEVDVNEIDVLTKSCRKKLLESSPANYEPATVTELFRRQVEGTPHNRALIHRDQQLTYTELWNASFKVAQTLVSRGAGPIVAILIDRSVEMITGLFGILQSGCAFLPIDPDYPEERIAHILSDSQCRFVVTSKKYANKITGAELIFMEEIGEESCELPAIAPTDLAYVIYTSGTTGLPNGVMIAHQSLVNLCQWHKEYYGLTENDVSTKYAGFGFDATVWEIFPALLSGGSLYIIEEEIRFNLTALAANYAKHGVTISFLPTQLGEQFMQQPTQCTTLKKLLVGGDKLKSLQPNLPYEVYNNYGPTENTVVATACKVNSNAKNIPIGKPIATSQVYILVPGSTQLQPVGVPGELCISGDCLAQGYLGKPELTARKFIANPFVPGARLYRTGDLARWLPDGNIEFLGRIDNQVKIRGYRIEPGEIERAMVNHPHVKDAAVVKKEDYLCAYYTSTEEIAPAELTTFLNAQLPFYMVPAVFVRLHQIPANANGKVDRAHLAQREEKRKIKAPETAIEHLMVKTWREVLGAGEVCIEDNFFVLGGDSIKAIQIQSRMRTHGYMLKTRSIFQSSNIRELCRLAISQKQLHNSAIVTGEVPLTPIQAEFFSNENISNKHHFNQAIMLEFDEVVDATLIKNIFQKLVMHHDSLRMVYKPVQEIRPEMVVDVEVCETDSIQEKCNDVQASFNIEEGPLMKLVLFGGRKLLVACHHLVVDGVSWRILLEDIETLFQGLQLPPKSDSFRSFAERLAQYQPPHHDWKITETKLFAVTPGESNFVGDTASVDVILDETQTALLLQGANHAYGTEINHLLLSGLALALNRTCGANEIQIWLEGHGREEIFNDIDISRTVGWFTTIYPLTLTVADSNIIINTKDAMNRVPGKGIGYGLLNRQKVNREIIFNYLGQFDSDINAKSFKVTNELVGNLNDPKNQRDCEVEILGMVVNGKLQMSVKYNPRRIQIHQLADNYKAALLEVIAHCAAIQQRIFTPTDFTYKQLPVETVAALTAKHDIADIYELSSSQEGMLFHSRLDQHSGAYHEQISYEVEALFDAAILEQTLNVLFERHALLRTCFYSKDLAVPVQVVLKSRKPEFSYVESGDVEQYLADDRKRNFNLTDDVLLRLRVFKTGANSTHFVWSYHHILMDGWCVGIISSEFYTIYQSLVAGRHVALPAAKPYSEYIQWLRQRDQQASGKYWNNCLDGLNALTPICGSAANGYEDAKEILSFSPAVTKRLQDLAAASRVTLSTLLECVWAVILSRYTNTNDVLFGKVVSGRPSEIEGIESMVGLFIKTIPSRISYEKETSFQQLLGRVQEQVLQTEQHQYYPLAKIGNKLFDHIFAFENYPYENAGIQLKNIEAFEQTNYDFNIVAAPGESLNITFKYNSLSFEKYYVEGIRDAFAFVIQQICIDPGLSIEKIVLVNEVAFSHAPTHYEPATVTELFRRQVESTPHNRALIHRDQQLTYAELWNASCKVAQTLVSCGAGPIVAILIDRSVEMITGLFGILQSGCAFLPIDPDYPEERIAHILSDSQCRFVVTSKKYANKITGAELIFMEEIGAATCELPSISPTDIAYVIYTSGTTGLPNGVMIAHQSLVNLCQWHKEYYGLTENDVSTKYAGFGFDATVWEIFPALLSGGSLYIIEEEIRFNLTALAANYAKHGVTISFLPTQLGEQFMQQPTECTSLKKLLVGGDKLKSLQPNLPYEVYNNYGPTENTVVATACKVNSNAKNIPIGKPIATSQVYILVPGSTQLQPVGVPGELCITGDCLAQGYLGKPELTERKFIANPFVPGARLYRTGDLARWLPDGNIEFLGRIDNQVKIRGYRIEPGEIETTMVSHEGVHEAAIIVKQNNNGYNLLYAFYTGQPSADELRIFLANNLPPYMVPAQFIRLEQMPVNQNGKLDKHQLQAYQLPERQISPATAANATQATLAGIWTKVLGIEQVSITDSFFDLGGTSLDMVRVNDELTKLYPAENLLIQMFKYPTISALAAFLDGQGNSTQDVTAAKTEDVKSNRMRQREKRRSNPNSNS